MLNSPAEVIALLAPRKLAFGSRIPFLLNPRKCRNMWSFRFNKSIKFISSHLVVENNEGNTSKPLIPKRIRLLNLYYGEFDEIALLIIQKC